MTDLVSLPVELITLIADFTSPCSHFAFACTCRYVFACLHDVRERHERAYQHRVCSDLSPTTVPNTLRCVLADPIAAWHVKEVEWWLNRKYWANWMTFEINDPGDDDARSQHEEPLEWSFQEDEIEHFLDIMQEHTSDLRQGRNELHAQILRGDDGIMKALILLLCPRLRSVKYVQNDCNAIRADGALLVNTSLPWLLDVIKFHRHKEAHLWPPGLQSMNRLAIGVESGTWFDQELTIEQSPGDLANLLCLPGLESIYFRGLGSANLVQNSEHYTSILADGCSSVQRIFLDQMSDMTSGFWRKVVSACKNQLTDVAFRSSTLFAFDRYISHAREIVPDLQSLMIYDPQEDYLPGHRDRYYNLGDLGGYNGGHCLRQITTTIWDLSCAALDFCRERPQLRFRDGFVRFFAPSQPADASFPGSMEVLVINGDFHRASRVCGGDIEKLAAYFDEGLAAMITGKAKSEPADHRSDPGIETTYLFPNLKAIFIEPWADHQLGPWKTHLWLQKAIKAGIERGVDVRTRTNVNPPMHRDITFHMPPNPHDLHSRPRDSSDGNDEEFDVFNGRWKDRGCGNCAKCKDCLELFPEKMWETAYRASKKHVSE